VGTAGAGFLWSDARPVANQIVNIWIAVRSSDTRVLNSFAQGPATHG